MASSAVDVCNMALQLLGVRPIASLTEGTKAASIANQIFADERDAALRAHPWNFALQRALLAQDAAAPAFKWSYAYQLPTSPYCLRVLAMSEDVPYAVEGRKLLTDNGTAAILYIARIEAPSLWDALFTSALAVRLAAKMAYPLTEQAGMQGQMAELYQYTLGEARSTDSQEGSTQDSGNNLLIDVRGHLFDRRSGWTQGW